MRIQKSARRKVISTKHGHTIEYDEVKVVYAKATIDGIDSALAELYGLICEELDFIINYDIKYRMGLDGGEGDGE